jgi:glycosyltransferase involved in cell wall biosynthesis
LRILVVAPFLPDPEATHGGGLYLGTLCAAMAAEADLGLVAQIRDREAGRLPACKSMFRWLATAPFRERPRGPGLLVHRVRMLVHWGLRRKPLIAAKHWDPQLPRLLRRAVSEFAPDVALVELAQMAQYLPHLSPVPTVFTDHECGLPANARTELGAWADRREARLWHAYVRRFYPRATLLQAVTVEDARALGDELGREIALRPPTLAVPTWPVTPERTPPRALFLGDYSHFPNPEAASVLVRDVLPALRAQVPDAELWLAGTNAERLNGLSGAPGVRVVGFAPDLARLFADVRLMLAPLYSGAGFRMKSLSALAHGLPVITNALGARGCSAPPPARIVAADDRALVAAAVDLLRAPDHAAAAGRAAHAWAREHLAPSVVAKAQLERIARLR